MWGREVSVGEVAGRLRWLGGTFCMVSWRERQRDELRSVHIPALVTQVRGLISASLLCGQETPRTGDMVVVRVLGDGAPMLFQARIARADDGHLAIRWPEAVRLVG